MKRILLFCSAIFCTTSFAQFDLSVHAGAGTSYIHNSATVNMNHLYFGSPIRSLPRMSFETGVTGYYYMDHLSFSLGLNYNQISSFQREETFVSNQGSNSFGSGLITVEKERVLGYLAVPVMMNREYRPIAVGGGLQPQFTIHTSEKRTMTAQNPNDPVNAVGEIEDDRTITTFDIGWIFQINAKASKRISVNFKAYWGLWNINNFGEKGANYEYGGIENPVVDRKLKTRQFVITAQYKIFGRKEDPSAREKAHK